MAIKQAVTTIFKSKDDSVSKNFRRMGKSADKFGEKGSRAFKKVSKSATSAGTIMKGVLGAGLISNALGLVGRGLSTVTTEFLGFDDAITSASAKFQGLDLTTKKGQETLKQLGKTAREVAATTKFSGQTAAVGLDFYATAGLNARQAMKLLKPTADLAIAANLDLARTSDIASDSLGIFGLTTKDPIQLQKNFMKMSDQMAKTMTSSNTTLEQLFETTKKGGKIFKDSGQSMATFNSFARALANDSIKGEKAGTGLQAFMAKLAKPIGEAGDALEALGVRTTRGNGKFRDAIDIIADFEKGMKGMGNQQRLAAIKTIFGLETMTTFSTLMKTGSKNLRKYREEVKDSGDATEKMSKIMGRSLLNKLLELKSASIDVGFQLLSAFRGQGATAIDAFTRAINGIDMEPVISGIKTFLGFGKKLFDKFVEIGERTGLFKNIQKSLEEVKPIFSTFREIISDVWSSLERTGVFDLLATAFKILFKAVGPIGKAFKLMWRVVRPIIQSMEVIFGPIVKAITFLLNGLGLALDALDEQLGKEFTKFSAQNIVTSDFRQQERGSRKQDQPGFRDRKKERDLAFIKSEREGAFPTIKSENLLPGLRTFKRKVIPLSKTQETFKRKVTPPPRIQPPTQENTTFKGQLDISGAPEGSEFRQKSTGPGQIDVKMRNRGKPVLQEAG